MGFSQTVKAINALNPSPEVLKIWKENEEYQHDLKLILCNWIKKKSVFTWKCIWGNVTKTNISNSWVNFTACRYIDSSTDKNARHSIPGKYTNLKKYPEPCSASHSKLHESSSKIFMHKFYVLSCLFRWAMLIILLASCFHIAIVMLYIIAVLF